MENKSLSVGSRVKGVWKTKSPEAEVKCDINKCAIFDVFFYKI